MKRRTEKYFWNLFDINYSSFEKRERLSEHQISIFLVTDTIFTASKMHFALSYYASERLIEILPVIICILDHAFAIYII